MEDADHVRTLYGYNPMGERTTTALKLDANSSITYGTDQITRTETYPNGAWLETATKVWQEGTPLVEAIVSVNRRSPNGLTTQTWTGNPNTAGNQPTTTVATIGLARTETTTSPDHTLTRNYYENGQMIATTHWAANSTLPNSAPPDITQVTATDFINGTSFIPDSLKRPWKQTDSRTGTTITTYMSATCDAVASVEAPGGRVTAFTYDNRGNRLTVDAPDTAAGGNVTTTAYDTDGTVLSVSGAQAYPVSYIYDYAGRVKTLTTTSGTTTWNYDSATGQLLSKLDNEGKGASYAYSLAGRLKTRTWARGRITSYGYVSGRLSTVDYFGTPSLWSAYLTKRTAWQTAKDDPDSTPGEITAAEAGMNSAYATNAAAPDPTTPALAYTFDTLGRPKSITQNKQSKLEYTYATDLGINTETISYDRDHDGNLDFTRVLDRNDRSLGRDTGWQLQLITGTPPNRNTTIQNQATYAYHSTTGRLATVSNGTASFSYGYQAGSYGLVRTVTGPVHTVTNTWDSGRDLLLTKANTKTTGNLDVSSITYTVNDLGQRTNASRTGTATNSTIWGYDNLGQLVQANDSTNSSDRAYQYDSIGNRVKTATGTLILPDAPNYGTNALNQYTTIPLAPATPGFDLDGNMTSGPLPVAPTANSTLVWDGENRMASTTVNGVTTSYHYDALSRRIAKAPASGAATLYLYDGFNCIAEYNGTTLAVAQTYLWGMDLSGSMQGAGGVGGLLAVNQGGTYYPCYDGNGNITEYLAITTPDDPATSEVNEQVVSVVAHYEYDPFGNDITPSDEAIAGVQHGDFAYRFSTKPLDFETGLYYYTYRYYDPVTGRWPSRDPMGDDAFVEMRWTNLFGREQSMQMLEITQSNNYGIAASIPEINKEIEAKDTAMRNCLLFVNNAPIGQVDNLGLFGISRKYADIVGGPGGPGTDTLCCICTVWGTPDHMFPSPIRAVQLGARIISIKMQYALACLTYGQGMKTELLCEQLDDAWRTLF